MLPLRKKKHEAREVRDLAHSGIAQLQVNGFPILGRLRSFLETIRGSYWFLPTFMAFGAVVAAFGLVELDSLVNLRRIPWIGSTEAENTRSVLSLIAGSMITVTGVVFSITVVALTLASSQFGPRILRNFLRARANQIAFGTFVATFLYSLLVLRAVRGQQVPHIASAMAVIFAVFSLFVLIYFIHHTARSIQASTIIASVAKEIDVLIPRLFPESRDEDEAQAGASSIEELQARLAKDGVEVAATSDGYVRVLDDDAVLSTAVKHELFIMLRYRSGDFVCAGNSIARVGPTDNATDEIMRSLRESFVFGNYRTPVQDLRVLTGQLTEVALRALSPGVNDPRTANDCVQRLGAVVCATANREMPVGCRKDDSGTLRVVLPHTTFEEIVSSCFDPIRRYGIEHVQIVIALFDALRDAGECCRDPARRRILAEHALEIQSDFEAQGRKSARDVAKVERAFEQAMRLLSSQSPNQMASGG
ncbi:MAG: DUF2254 domain-containing protein [Myxococcales bacterium]|jgi:uncharacterized membrane protein